MPSPTFLSIAWPYLLAALAFGYALGSIPFGLLLTRAAGLGDIRKVGSGNIGATNVLRTGNKKLAAATLLLDAAKGLVAVLIAGQLAGPDAAIAAALGAVLGHLFPVWLGFKGGKGMATALGVLWGLSWGLGAFACLVWLLAAALFRYSSLATLLSIALAAAAAWFLSSTRIFGMAFSSAHVAALVTLLALLVFAKHHANLRRLFSGTEPKIGQRK
jgi:acyl phosphate:glycerol-3-phosphate acyltransferase